MSIATEERYINSPKNWVIFDGKALKDYGVYCSGDKTFSAPQRNVDSITIPGRNGTLERDKGSFANITVEYSCWIGSNFRGNIEGLRNYLLSKAGFKRLEDTYDPDTFRLASFHGPLDVSAYYSSTFGSFGLQFTARPERFLKSGEDPISITNGTIINNPTLFAANPVIEIDMSNTLPLQIKFGDYTITIRDTLGDPLSKLVIDTDNLNAYGITTNTEEKVNCNDMITPKYKDKWVKLEPGETVVSSDFNVISGVSIIPRWWIL